ncbi:MAG: hypothetical protein QFC78_03490 [Pseudomonadota bacterium]|nr:hypothetical protein [Pseudomonadota bacterium]
MSSAILLFAGQALALAAPATALSPPLRVRVTALATAEILRAETTRDDGAQALIRHRRTDADGRAIIDFE